MGHSVVTMEKGSGASGSTPPLAQGESAEGAQHPPRRAIGYVEASSSYEGSMKFDILVVV